MVKDHSGNITTSSKYKINIIDITSPMIEYKKLNLDSNDLDYELENIENENFDIEVY